MGVEDIALDPPKRLIDVDLHVERRLELRERVRAGTADGGLEFRVEQFVYLPKLHGDLVLPLQSCEDTPARARTFR